MERTLDGTLALLDFGRYTQAKAWTKLLKFVICPLGHGLVEMVFSDIRAIKVANTLLDRTRFAGVKSGVAFETSWYSVACAITEFPREEMVASGSELAAVVTRRSVLAMVTHLAAVGAKEPPLS